MEKNKEDGNNLTGQDSGQKKEEFAHIARLACLFFCPDYQAEAVWNGDRSRMGVILWKEGAATASAIWVDRLWEKYREGWGLDKVFDALEEACVCMFMSDKHALENMKRYPEQILPFIRAELKLAHTWKKGRSLGELWEQCLDIDDVVEDVMTG